MCASEEIGNAPWIKKQRAKWIEEIKKRLFEEKEVDVSIEWFPSPDQATVLFEEFFGGTVWSGRADKVVEQLEEIKRLIDSLSPRLAACAKEIRDIVRIEREPEAEEDEDEEEEEDEDD